MTFRSILRPRPGAQGPPATVAAPAYFRDLNLDQIVDAITAGYESYDLKPFYYGSLPDVDSALYRQEVFRDLENAHTCEAVKRFAARMRDVRSELVAVREIRHPYQQQAWFLDAVEIYSTAVLGFADALATAPLAARGLLGFRDYLRRYADGDALTSLLAETKAIQAALAEIRYSLLIKEGSVKVSRYRSAPDFSAEITATFARFKEGADREYRADTSSDRHMNHVKEGILDRVAMLYPDTFAALGEYCTRNADFMDDVIVRFDREVQFYLAYLHHIEPLKSAGLAFCYPRLTVQSKRVHSVDSFDLALATALVRQRKPVVCNDFHLGSGERILVVTGPNQGGKTTFARAFGQLHHLASIGCPVPGSDAHLSLFDNIFSHFEREERVGSLRSKLEDDLIRIHHIVIAANAGSIVILNEIFTSTTLGDSIFLSTRIMERLLDLGVLGVWVTFVDELASFGTQCVSMVGSVVAENPAERTYKIRRQPADGLAYALAIAEKHGLTRERLRERLES